MAKSKMLDLVRVTNAATKLLMRIETTVSNLSELTGPAVPPTAIGRLIPSRHLGHLVALRAAAEDLKPVFLEQHVWEFAGLALPSGIPIGAGFWSSAHLLMSDVARIVQTTTQEVLDVRGIYDRAVSTYKPDSGTASIAKDVSNEFDEHWNRLAHRGEYEHPEDEIDDRYEHFLELVWGLLEALRLIVGNRALASHLEVEHAAARRHRHGHVDQGPFPKSHLHSPARAGSLSSTSLDFAHTSEASVMQFLAGVASAWKATPKGTTPSLTAIYVESGLRGASKTRAKDAAHKLGLVNSKNRLTARGTRLLYKTL